MRLCPFSGWPREIFSRLTAACLRVCIVPDPGAAAPQLGSAIPHCTGQWSDIFTIGSAPVLSLQETSRLAGVLNGGPALNTRLYNTVNTRQRNAWLFAFARDRNIRERTSSCHGENFQRGDTRNGTAFTRIMDHCTPLASLRRFLRDWSKLPASSPRIKFSHSHRRSEKIRCRRRGKIASLMVSVLADLGRNFA